MQRLLITPSLLNSFYFYHAAEEENETEARADFMATLSRVRDGIKNENIAKGIELEERVERLRAHYAATGRWLHDASEGVRKIAIKCKNATPQVRFTRPLGEQFLIYCRTDYVHANTAIDVKFSRGYDVGKYVASAQHLAYFYAGQVPRVAFLISDFNHFYEEEYFNHPDVEAILLARCEELVAYMRADKEAGQVFFERWGAQ